MSRSKSIGAIAAMSALVATSFSHASDAPASNVAAIHAGALTVDTHVDVPLDYASSSVDPGGFTELQVDLPKMRAGGLDAAFFIVYTPQGLSTEEGYAEGLEIAETRLSAIRRMVAAYPDQIALATTTSAAREIAAAGKRVALIGMENAFPLGPGEAGVQAAERWAAAGVRYMGLVHFGHNQYADSSNFRLDRGDPKEKYGGLSDLGKALVVELNRLGVMVDVSHASKKSMMQAAEISKAPIIASHSGARAVAESPRNLDDEQLRVLAANGGVAQMVALDTYVKPLDRVQIALQTRLQPEYRLRTTAEREAASPETLEKYRERLKERWAVSPRATVSDFVDHIDHAVKIAGIDHVGIASDFDGGGGVDGWDDASETRNVTAELVRRGYSKEDINKIWGGNVLRVLAEVEAVAARLASASAAPTISAAPAAPAPTTNGDFR